MKRWIAWFLAFCLCVSPVLACAQSMATEELFSQLFAKLALQAESPSLSVTGEMPEGGFDLCFALDDQGFPDFSCGAYNRNDAVRYDADAAGIRYDDGNEKIAVTLETLLRVLAAEENGAAFTQADAELFAAMAEEILAASGGAVTRILRKLPAQENSTQAEGTQALAVQQVTTVDIVRLLAIWDTEIPAALVRHAPELNDFMSRNKAAICDMLGVSEPPAAEQLALNWPKPGLSGLILEGIPETVTIEETVDVSGGMTTVIAVHRSDTQLAEVNCVGGRVYGWLGSKEYAFDSHDLYTAAALLAQLPGHISKAAFDWTYSKYGNEAITAHLTLDAERLIEDLASGFVYIWQRNRAEISALLERYAPWMELFGLADPSNMDWEMLLENILDEQADWVSDLSEEVKWYLRRNLLSRELFGMELPKVRLDAVIPLRTKNMPVASLSISTNMVQYDFSLSYGHLSSILQTVGRNGVQEKQILRGAYTQEHALLTYTEERVAIQKNAWQIEWTAKENGWFAELRGAEQEQLATAECTGKHILLKTEDLRADLTLIPAGFTLTGMMDGERFGAEVVSSEGTTRLYAGSDAWALQLLSIEERNVSTLQAVLQDNTKAMDYRFEMRGSEESLAVKAQSSRSALTMFDMQLDLQQIGGMPSVHASMTDRNTEAKLAYLPGMLDIAVYNTISKETVDLRVSDVTAQNMPGNETRVDLLVREKRGDRLFTSDESWTAKTDVQGDVYTTKVYYDDEECLILTLDFAASPVTQDLTGYTWLTEKEVRGMIREAMATPTPLPTSAPTPAPAAP